MHSFTMFELSSTVQAARKKSGHAAQEKLTRASLKG
jgi:hypothetical protein